MPHPKFFSDAAGQKIDLVLYKNLYAFDDYGFSIVFYSFCGGSHLISKKRDK